MIKSLCGKGINILRTESQDYCEAGCSPLGEVERSSPGAGVQFCRSLTLRVEHF